MKKDILMLDCDGTCILGRTKGLTDFTYVTFQKAQEKFYVVFNTGRNLKQFFEVVKQGIGDYVGCLNGKALYDLKNKKYIYTDTNKFSRAEIDKILELAGNFDEVNSYFFQTTNYYDNTLKEQNADDILKYIALSNNMEQIEELYSLIEKEFKGYFFEFARIGGKSGKWIELWKTQSNKRDLIQLVRDQLVESGKLYYFGDSDNDIEAIKLADYKVEPQNAIDEIKQIADIILPHTCSEDGVAKYIQTLL